ncbi:uncharacterized protein BDW43DRAFT_313277 [Aspergillus alliaceus]|uniref:uncharacterized protein n=1 Tax=Petromyces alliaceus TaxID=209559 RepID=UPI0012A560DE|nr:uncharacterized protein BDW43DRAFT_313277 [Aspergillus alliaceus]KAB8231197.1 hypothetical protein BDW43DRAFT_313277 [Aspergillus alliaceus]
MPPTIYAMFKGNQDGATAKPKCSLEADWPSSYGDVYFGADNCLYDSNGQNINSQCCKMSNDLPEVANPYH